MAPQYLNRGLATLAITGLLTLVALGGALLALQIGTSQGAGQRASLEARHLDAVLEAMLLDLLANPSALQHLVQQRSSCRSRLDLRDGDGHALSLRLDRCRTGPDSVRVHLEAGSPALHRMVNVRVRRRDGRWRIVPGSWHDFDT